MIQPPRLVGSLLLALALSSTTGTAIMPQGRPRYAKLSTMVSYRPNGEIYDGRGIAPDVLAQPTLRDLLGETDSVLERARARLKR